jgi:hypothetical protein
MGLLDTILGGLGGFVTGGPIGGLIGLGGQLLANNQNQNYATQMSNTSYQRSSQDMMAAGLNPMMMFGGGTGASTPSVQNQNVGAAALSGMQGAVSTSVAMKTANATIDNLVAQNAKIKADTITAGVDAKLRAAQIATEKRRPLQIDQSVYTDAARGVNLIADTDLKQSSLVPLNNAVLTAKNQMDMNPEMRKLLDQGGFAGKRVDDLLSPVSTLVSGARGVVNLVADHKTRKRVSKWLDEDVNDNVQ